MQSRKNKKCAGTGEQIIGGVSGVEISGAYVINLADAHAYHFILKGDLLISIVGAPVPFQSDILTFHLVQGADTPSTVYWPDCIKWGSGTPPTLSASRGLRDMIQLETPDYGLTWRDTLIGIGYSAQDAV